MRRLTDSELLDTYQKAKELNCSQDFITLLRQEMIKRKLNRNGYILNRQSS